MADRKKIQEMPSLTSETSKTPVLKSNIQHEFNQKNQGEIK